MGQRACCCQEPRMLLKNHSEALLRRITGTEISNLIENLELCKNAPLSSKLVEGTKRPNSGVLKLSSLKHETEELPNYQADTHRSKMLRQGNPNKFFEFVQNSLKIVKDDFNLIILYKQKLYYIHILHFIHECTANNP